MSQAYLNDIISKFPDDLIDNAESLSLTRALRKELFPKDIKSYYTATELQLGIITILSDSSIKLSTVEAKFGIPIRSLQRKLQDIRIHLS